MRDKGFKLYHRYLVGWGILLYILLFLYYIFLIYLLSYTTLPLYRPGGFFRAGQMPHTMCKKKREEVLISSLIGYTV